MNLSLRNLLLNKHSLKINALILGYWLWHTISYHQLQTITLRVPLCFYGNEAIKIDAPESISVALFGYKSDLILMSLHELAAHFDCKNFVVGDYPISVTHDTLFLPERIKLLHYSPSPIIIKVTKNN